MAEKKKQNPRYVTPAGVASWPKLNEPDTKFNAEGTYGVKLLLDPNDAKHKAFLDKLDGMADEAFEAMKKEHTKYSKQMTRVAPYAPELDSEGDETGKVVVNFTMPAVVERKKDKKKFTLKPALYDAAGTPLAADLKIGGGSTIQVSFESWAYFSAKDKEAGITRRLVAVRVIERKEWVGTQSAADFGFDVNDEFAATASTEGDDTEGVDDF